MNNEPNIMACQKRRRVLCFSFNTKVRSGYKWSDASHSPNTFSKRLYCEDHFVDNWFLVQLSTKCFLTPDQKNAKKKTR